MFDLVIYYRNGKRCYFSAVKHITYENDDMILLFADRIKKRIPLKSIKRMKQFYDGNIYALEYEGGDI